jgi:hypothetical protein
LLTSGWSEAVEGLLDRRHDDLVAYRRNHSDLGTDSLGWGELCREQVQPVARRLADAGQLSVRLLEPTWGHFAAGGPAYDELFRTRSPQIPDTELLILNHALFPDGVRGMTSDDIAGSELGICRLLQHALGWPLSRETDADPVGSVELQGNAPPLIAPLPAAGDAIVMDEGPDVVIRDQRQPGRRAIVCFVEDKAHLMQQCLALRLSWLYADPPDTDLVVIGPADTLARLPDDLIKIAQQPAADDPVWNDYRFINGFAALNGAGAEQLNAYSHLLRTDADTLITPAWNQFHPEQFFFGNGSHANDDVSRCRCIRDAAAEYGLMHRGITNVGATWYGPTPMVRRACAIAEMLTKHLLTNAFAEDEGGCDGRYRGAALRYAGEIAVNHCAPEAQCSALLDALSTSPEPIGRFPLIHCGNTDECFSKHRFTAERYAHDDFRGLDLEIISDYCMAMSVGSRALLAAVR